MNKQPTLEARISQALAAERNSVEDLQVLIGEVEAAIVVANSEAKHCHDQARDLANDDPLSALHSAQEAELIADRLQATIPQLEARLAAVAQAEICAHWRADYIRTKGKLAAAAQNFRRYPELINQLIDIFNEAASVDSEVNRVNASAPNNERERLTTVEQAARGLQEFSRATPSIVKTVQLPDWTNSARMAWPVKRPVDPALFAPAPYDPRYSSEWWRYAEADNQRRRAEGDRVTSFYIDQQRQRDEREEKEAAARRNGS